MHVLVDIKTRRVAARRDWTPRAANAFVDRAVEITGLSPFGERQVIEHDDLVIFCQLIAESHIIGHLDRHRGRAWVDVFSCRDVDADLVEAAVLQYLVPPSAASTSTVRVLDRGILP